MRGWRVGWRWGPAGWGPEGQDPNTQWWGPEISVFPHFRFFLVLGNLHVSFFLSLCVLVDFWWCFGRSGPQMCCCRPEVVV